jgi:hypothetical protein
VTGGELTVAVLGPFEVAVDGRPVEIGSGWRVTAPATPPVPTVATTSSDTSSFRPTRHCGRR